MKLKKALPLCGLALVLVSCGEHMRPRPTSMGASLDNAMANPAIATPVIIPEAAKSAHGSIWQPGNRQFFKDSRANKVGDIITIVVSENAEAETEANTETKRDTDMRADVDNLANLEGLLKARHILDPLTNNLLDTDSQKSYKGEGKTDRKDTLTANIAAVVTQVLPNGYMVVQGKREVVVNYELQDLQIQGIIRPEDVGSDNTIESSKIAEARIFYAGRGVIDETQTPQYGVRFMEKVLPF
ncbi:MAG: flagellar basal body L-ring protein FlgH [Alphaproteobacteria bacterium]